MILGVVGGGGGGPAGFYGSGVAKFMHGQGEEERRFSLIRKQKKCSD